MELQEFSAELVAKPMDVDAFPTFHEEVWSMKIGGRKIGYISMAINGAAFYISTTERDPRSENRETTMYVVPLAETMGELFNKIRDQWYPSTEALPAEETLAAMEEWNDAARA